MAQSTLFDLPRAIFEALRRAASAGADNPFITENEVNALLEALLPDDVVDALNGANAPSAGNVFATIADIMGLPPVEFRASYSGSQALPSGLGVDIDWDTIEENSDGWIISGGNTVVVQNSPVVGLAVASVGVSIPINVNFTDNANFQRTKMREGGADKAEVHYSSVKESNATNPAYNLATPIVYPSYLTVGKQLSVQHVNNSGIALSTNPNNAITYFHFVGLKVA